MTALPELAALAGIAIHWTDAFGTPCEVAPDTLRQVLGALGIPCGDQHAINDAAEALRRPPGLPPLLTADAGGLLLLPEGEGACEIALTGGGTQLERVVTPAGAAVRVPNQPGYHALRIDGVQTMLAIAPPRAPDVANLTGRPRAFGVAAQLYALRQPGDGGIGDCSGLRAAVRALGAAGADALALSPTHALFAAEPGRASPYAPSSRLALNPLLADPVPLFGEAACAAAWQHADQAGQRQAWEEDALIDWPRAAAARYAMLRALFGALPGHKSVQSAFGAWAETSPEALREHAVFEALHATHRAEKWDWRGWPASLRDPAGPAVAAFAASHSLEVEFHLFCQFLAAHSLGGTQAEARHAGMGIGLIADLAIGMDPAGSQAWSRPSDLLTGLSVGAPPDQLNRDGQGWGLTTFSPTALRATGYAPFLATLRAALRHAGGLRIDHVMGLRRLWLVPDGASPTEGAYLDMPATDLLRLVALEAHLHGALVIGEDLGTVPDGFREALAGRGILGMRVLPFERDARGRFLPPDGWQKDALAMTSTHDMQPIAGWWRGTDLGWQARLAGEMAPCPAALAARQADRTALWQAARDAGLTEAARPPPYRPQPAVDAAIAYVAATPAVLAIVPVEDLLGLEEAPNLPGTTDEHPNWRRRLPEPLSAALAHPNVAARLATLRRRTVPEPA
jgi:4-alpha-glucanotransferase